MSLEDQLVAIGALRGQGKTLDQIAEATGLEIGDVQSALSGALPAGISSPASVGGGVALGASADYAQGATVALTDATNKQAPIQPATPPAWLDSQGRITEAGLYAVYAFLGVGVVGNAGQFAYVVLPFQAAGHAPLDAYIDGGVGGVAFLDIGALGAADLPYDVGPMARLTPGAVGWQCTLGGLVARLAH